MNNYLLLFFMTIFLFSCKEKKSISLQASYKDKSNTYLIFNLFAKNSTHIECKNFDINLFTFFSFKKGKEVQKNEDWDVAFKDLIIAINGGKNYKYDNKPYYHRINRTKNIKAALIKISYDKLNKEKLRELIELGKINFRQDSENHYAINPSFGGNKFDSISNLIVFNWWDAKDRICPSCNSIIIHSNVSFVFDLGNNKYVKMRIIDYYKENIAGYYTFEYQFLDLQDCYMDPA